MRVIKEWEIQVCCTGEKNGMKGCGQRLAVAGSDLFVTTAGRYSKSNVRYYFTFCCPECGARTDIPKEKIPKAIRVKVMEDYKQKY